MTTDAVRVIAGRYRLVRAVGRGGMGAVWRAYDALLDREVAVKQVWIAGADELDDPDDPLVRRALREAQATARLRHPGVVTVHDVVTDRGRPWLVMELVDGGSLAQAIAEHGLLTEQRTAQVGLSILRALQAAHRAGVIHRDVKPANILLENTGRVVLTDFGIAAIDDKTALTATGQLLGSPAYLAPERVNGRPAGPASDLWALGVTLYTTVTGRSPFQREDAQATVAAVLTAEPPALAHAGRLWPVIKGLLAKDPDQRLTAEQAAPLLTRIAEPDDAPADRDTGSTRPASGRTPRRRPAASWETRLDGLPATLDAPAPTVAAPTDYQPPASPRPQVSPPPPVPAELGPGPELDLATFAEIPATAAPAPASGTPDTSDPSTTAGRPERTPTARTRRIRRRYITAIVAVIVLAPAGNAVWQADKEQQNKQNDSTLGVVPSVVPSAGVPQKWRSTRTLTGHTDLVNTVAYSPDGKHLATAGHDRKVRVWDLASGRSRTLTGHTDTVRAVAYSPDGKHLATAGHDRKVRVWDLASGRSRTLTGHARMVSAVAYSPDGKQLATAGQDETVRVWDLASGDSRILTGHTGTVFAVAYSPDGKQLASSSEDETIRIWDLAGGRSRTLTGRATSMPEIAFSPDGKHLATAGYDGKVGVWDLAGGTFRTLTGHTAAVYGVAYSPDGKHIASSSEDETVRVWDLASGDSRILTGHTALVSAVAYSPDGEHVASSSLDTTVRVWERS